MANGVAIETATEVAHDRSKEIDFPVAKGLHCTIAASSKHDDVATARGPDHIARRNPACQQW